MGLGKTIQSMSILQWFKDRGHRGPFLVIVPTSCLSQWKRELETWTTLDVVEYHGNARSRALIQEHEIYFGKKKTTDVKFNVLLTTYEMLNKDNNFLSRFNWTYAVIDEAHRMKASIAYYFPLTPFRVLPHNSSILCAHFLVIIICCSLERRFKIT